MSMLRAPADGSRPWPVRVRRLLPWVLFNLLPSFVQHRLYPPLKQKRDLPLHPTAFLDGIRGVAALFVYFHHFYFVTHDVSHAYGKDNDLFSSLPIVRLLICGHSIVSLFFVVSGFALSVKPLRLMKNRDWNGLHLTLSSSVVRRVLRLYLPCIASTFLVVILLRLHIYENAGRYIATNSRILTAFREKHPVRKKTLFLEFQSWIGALLGLFNPWTNSTSAWHPPYDPHLWSVATEFRASMMLFVVQLGVSRLIPAARRTCLFVLILFCFFKLWWTAIFFYSGFLIADFHIFETSPVPPSSHHSLLPAFSKLKRPLSRYQVLWLRLRKLFWLLTFIFGLYTASAPAKHFERTFGFQTLGRLTPPPYYKSPTSFWNGLGVILIVFTTTNSPTLQRLFTARSLQYLGRVSFSIYLVHGPAIHTIGYATLKAAWTLTTLRTRSARETGFWLAAAATTLATLWAADVFARAVDAPAQRAARWAERACSVRGAPLDGEVDPDGHGGGYGYGYGYGYGHGHGHGHDRDRERGKDGDGPARPSLHRLRRLSAGGSAGGGPGERREVVFSNESRRRDSGGGSMGMSMNGRGLVRWNSTGEGGGGRRGGEAV